MILKFDGDGFNEFSMMLDRFKRNATDAQPAFEKMADHQAGVWAKAFKTGGASMTEGRWDPLSPAYGAWKSRNFPGKGILELRGELRNSLTRRPFSVEVITEKKMILGTAVPHAKFHQHGQGNNPLRQMVGEQAREDTKAFAKFLHEHVFETEGI